MTLCPAAPEQTRFLKDEGLRDASPLPFRLPADRVQCLFSNYTTPPFFPDPRLTKSGAYTPENVADILNVAQTAEYFTDLFLYVRKAAGLLIALGFVGGSGTPAVFPGLDAAAMATGGGAMIRSAPDNAAEGSMVTTNITAEHK